MGDKCDNGTVHKISTEHNVAQLQNVFRALSSPNLCSTYVSIPHSQARDSRNSGHTVQPPVHRPGHGTERSRDEPEPRLL